MVLLVRKSLRLKYKDIESKKALSSKDIRKTVNLVKRGRGRRRGS